MNGLKQEKKTQVKMELEGEIFEKKVKKDTLEEELAAFKERLKKIAEADSEFILPIKAEAEKTVKFSIEKNGKTQSSFEFDPLENEIKFEFSPDLSFAEKKAAFKRGMDACSHSMSGNTVKINLPNAANAREVWEAVLADEINSGKVVGLSLDHNSMTPEIRKEIINSLIAKGVDSGKLKAALKNGSSSEAIKLLDDILTKSSVSQAPEQNAEEQSLVNKINNGDVKVIGISDLSIKRQTEKLNSWIDEGVDPVKLKAALEKGSSSKSIKLLDEILLAKNSVSQAPQQNVEEQPLMNKETESDLNQSTAQEQLIPHRTELDVKKSNAQKSVVKNTYERMRKERAPLKKELEAKEERIKDSLSENANEQFSVERQLVREREKLNKMEDPKSKPLVYDREESIVLSNRALLEEEYRQQVSKVERLNKDQVNLQKRQEQLEIDLHTNEVIFTGNLFSRKSREKGSEQAEISVSSDYEQIVREQPSINKETKSDKKQSEAGRLSEQQNNGHLASSSVSVPANSFSSTVKGGLDEENSHTALSETRNHDDTHLRLRSSTAFRSVAEGCIAESAANLGTEESPSNSR